MTPSVHHHDGDNRCRQRLCRCRRYEPIPYPTEVCGVCRHPRSFHRRSSPRSFIWTCDAWSCTCWLMADTPWATRPCRWCGHSHHMHGEHPPARPQFVSLPRRSTLADRESSKPESRGLRPRPTLRLPTHPISPTEVREELPVPDASAAGWRKALPSPTGHRGPVAEVADGLAPGDGGPGALDRKPHR